MSAAGFELAVSDDMVDLRALLRITGYGRSAAYEAMAAQLLPRPVKFGRASRWPQHELLAVRTAILRGDDEASRRALVRRMRAQRGGSPLSRVGG